MGVLRVLGARLVGAAFWQERRSAMTLAYSAVEGRPECTGGARPQLGPEASLLHKALRPTALGGLTPHS